MFVQSLTVVKENINLADSLEEKKNLMRWLKNYIIVKKTATLAQENKELKVV